jgi:hypothetical protein
VDGKDARGVGHVESAGRGEISDGRRLTKRPADVRGDAAAEKGCRASRTC